MYVQIVTLHARLFEVPYMLITGGLWDHKTANYSGLCIREMNCLQPKRSQNPTGTSGRVSGLAYLWSARHEGMDPCSSPYRTHSSSFQFS